MAERVNDNEIISSLKAKKLAEPKSLSVRFELAIVYKQH